MPGHDIVVIGGSAGAVPVLLEALPALPADLPASVFVALHSSPRHDSLLPELLRARGGMIAEHPVHREPIARGRIYVAPPDNHLSVKDGMMEVARGPMEGGHRPSVDVLFRTAARAYGSRVVAVVLSGYQDCGTAGMMSVRARGGIGVVQALDTAAVPDMPRSVLDRVQVEHVVPPVELPALLQRLVAQPAGEAPRPDAAIAGLEGDRRGAAAELVCPACGGVLTDSQKDGFHQLRCHVGHAFSLEALARAQGDALEHALWGAVRALEESAALNRRLADVGGGELARRHREKADTLLRQADLIREILLHAPTATAAAAAVRH